MFDAKIQQIIDTVSEKVDDKLYERVLDLKDYMNSYMQSVGLFGRRLEDMSKQMKIAVGISLGLSVADTILLFAILIKMGR